MNNSTTKSPPPCTGGKEPQSAYGPQIAQTALQSIGMSAEEIRGMTTRSTEYAVTVSILFTKATNQAIMLGTEPRHVLSTSLLWNSLLHDKRFKPVAMSEAAPGDVIVASGWNQAAGYAGFAGIVVDHGRIVSMGTGCAVQNNSSLIEIQRNHQPTALFRYIGVQRYPSHPLANAGYDPSEARLPAGQSGGGQWTSTGAGGAPHGVLGAPSVQQRQIIPDVKAVQRTPAAPAANPSTAGQATTGPQSSSVTAGERAAEAGKFARLAKLYFQKADDEDQLASPATLAFDGFGRPNDDERDKLAAKDARDLAEEMQRRAYILEHGKEDDYRRLMLQQYGVNNPDLDQIAAYYAEKFNDQTTLNWLKLQHPATRPHLDAKGLAMMALVPEGEAAEEAPQIGGTAEKSVFEQTSNIEKGAKSGDGEAVSEGAAMASEPSAGGHSIDDTAKGASPGAGEIPTKNNYRATFFAAHPELEGQVVVHHAVEQQVLTRYPGLFSESEINSLGNLRGIPADANSNLHLSQIRRSWNRFYRSNPNPTREQILQRARQIDSQFGSKFQPSS